MTDKDPVPYSELCRIADQILEIGEDRPDLLAGELERLPQSIRSELLASDLLNAYQIFYYYFREDPGDLEKDRLTLQPASALSVGVMITGTDLFEVIFSVEEEEPLFSVSDGEQIIARFRGTGSYRKVLRFLDESS